MPDLTSDALPVTQATAGNLDVELNPSPLFRRMVAERDDLARELDKALTDREQLRRERDTAVTCAAGYVTALEEIISAHCTRSATTIAREVLEGGHA